MNLSAFHGFYDLFEQAYGVDRATITAIAQANDQGVPMRVVAHMIP